MAETVYGTHEESHVMSEKVQTLAASIYKEFERMIKKYDEDVVKELMPLVVGILENLDQTSNEKQEIEVEIELLRDDNEQLLTQYEREKQLRKGSEQKYLEMEDAVEGEKRELQEKVESLESIVRMLELKSKNAADHVSRLEDKEVEMKKEYTKLHERYTELFKTHMDYMERTKIIMGTDRIGDLNNSPRNVRGSFQLPNLKPVNIVCGGNSDTPQKNEPITPGCDISSPRSGKDSNISIKSELSELDSPDESVRHSKRDKRRKVSGGDKVKKETSDKEQITDNIVVRESATTTGKSDRSAPDIPEHDTSKEEDHEHPQFEKHSDIQISDINDETNELSPQSRLTSSQSESELTDSLKRSSVSSKLKEPLYNSTPILSMLHLGIDSEIDRFEESLPGLNRSIAEIVATTPELDELDESVGNENLAVYKPSRNNTSIFDELSSQDSHLIGDVDFGADITDSESDENDDKVSSVSDNFFGMGKELENLILENTELLATKNALNIVKDDLIAKVDELTGEQEILREEINSLQLVRTKLQQRIKDLEDELKKTKEELENKNQAAKEEDGEEEIPMAQRKRFTRVEMARVLMERNQYKERLMELQEAVRWTEMIRASREHPDMSSQKQKKSSIWNFFSNLFSSSSSEKPGRKKPSPAATIKYSAPTTQVQPVGDPNKKERSKYNMGNKAKAYDFLQEDITTEKLKKEREKERREQYKLVRAHVKKDDGRMQAYGWSLPAKFQPHISSREVGSSNKSNVPVPVPVYCRPLIESETGLKIWCAAGANLTGGKTKDGGCIVGGSVFYSNPPEEQENRKDTKDEIEKLNQELKDHEKSMKDVEQMSSLLWICTGTNTGNRVNVIDANNPGDILDTIRVSTSPILCIASVPGVLDTDFPVDEEILKSTGLVVIKPNIDNTGDNALEDNSNISELEDVKSDISSINSEDKDLNKPETEKEHSNSIGKESDDEDPLGATTVDNIQPAAQKATAAGSDTSSRPSTPGGDSSKEIPIEVDVHIEEIEKISSVLPTMWIGTQSGSLYVHSAVTHWRKCIHSVKLKDSILGIVHIRGRVFVSLADGSVAIFHRDKDMQWDLKNYHILDLGCPPHSVRCMCVIAQKQVWCGYKNKIHVVDPQNMNILKTFDAHPRKESQVRQMAWVGEGVWLSIRLDSTLRLYHAYTHQHLQDVDIEPYVSKMLGTGKLGFSFVRITAMLLASNRLWIGTGNGVIISIPLSEGRQAVNTGSTAGRPGGLIRVYSDSKGTSVTPGSFIPYCSMAQAQLSFHGHKDAVKFFCAVPGIPRKGMSAAFDESNNTQPKIQLEAQPAMPTNTKLVISGGEGYVDFRIGDADDDELVIEEDQKPNLNRTERSHLIVWQVTVD